VTHAIPLITTIAAARDWGLELLAEAIDGEENRTLFTVLARAS